jgi:hypothetical protein
VPAPGATRRETPCLGILDTENASFLKGGVQSMAEARLQPTWRYSSVGPSHRVLLHSVALVCHSPALPSTAGKLPAAFGRTVQPRRDHFTEAGPGKS